MSKIQIKTSAETYTIDSNATVHSRCADHDICNDIAGMYETDDVNYEQIIERASQSLTAPFSFGEFQAACEEAARELSR